MGVDPQKVRAGRISSPHGLDGSVKVADPVAPLLAKGSKVEVDGRLMTIERRSGTDAKPIIRLEGCTDRSMADQLRGVLLMVEREALPELTDDEWWVSDLVGLKVVDGDFQVGEVARVIGLPSCEALEVERASGTKLLVPIIGDAVRNVDLDSGTVDIDLTFLGESKG